MAVSIFNKHECPLAYFPRQQNVITLLLVTRGMIVCRNYIKHEQFVVQNLFAKLYN